LTLETTLIRYIWKQIANLSKKKNRRKSIERDQRPQEKLLGNDRKVLDIERGAGVPMTSKERDGGICAYRRRAL
jgi:hypothetical protein